MSTSHFAVVNGTRTDHYSYSINDATGEITEFSGKYSSELNAITRRTSDREFLMQFTGGDGARITTYSAGIATNTTDIRLQAGAIDQDVSGVSLFRETGQVAGAQDSTLYITTEGGTVSLALNMDNIPTGTIGFYGQPNFSNPQGLNTETLVLDRLVNVTSDQFPLPIQILHGVIPAPTIAPTAPTSAPSHAPTLGPTANPTFNPTANPTLAPTANPTRGPSAAPTFAPSANPTDAPTAPTSAPSAAPTFGPTSAPNPAPTGVPTFNPSANPTSAPTFSPTRAPTSLAPTGAPSFSPTGAPSAAPTFGPTGTPTSLAPSFNPTGVPTSQAPTFSPTGTPTSLAPSFNPTRTPTSQAPSFNPTNAPSAAPTGLPTSQAPTGAPTDRPSHAPTGVPTGAPTDIPSAAPTFNPTDAPNPAPTGAPSYFPTFSPTGTPTVGGSGSGNFPTFAPTFGGSGSGSGGSGLSYFPTSAPTAIPTNAPTTSGNTAAAAGFIQTDGGIAVVVVAGAVAVAAGIGAAVLKARGSRKREDGKVLGFDPGRADAWEESRDPERESIDLDEVVLASQVKTELEQAVEAAALEGYNETDPEAVNDTINTFNLAFEFLSTETAELGNIATLRDEINQLRAGQLEDDMAKKCRNYYHQRIHTQHDFGGHNTPALEKLFLIACDYYIKNNEELDLGTTTRDYEGAMDNKARANSRTFFAIQKTFTNPDIAEDVQVQEGEIRAPDPALITRKYQERFQAPGRDIISPRARAVAPRTLGAGRGGAAARTLTLDDEEGGGGDTSTDL